MTTKDSEPQEMAWECNQCGAQEWSANISETDIQELGCASCGGDEWHLTEARK